MKNKLYQVQGVRSDYCNIVSAPNAKEAKLIGANTEFTEDVDFTDLRVSAIKGGSSWYQEEPEIHFTIKGNGVIYTDIQTTLLTWKDFIEEVEKQKLIIINIGISFDEYAWSLNNNDYFGIPRKEYEDLVNKQDYHISNFDEFCEVYGVDVDKITFTQAEQLLDGELTLPQLKELQHNE